MAEVLAPTPSTPPILPSLPNLVWHDAAKLTISGKGWLNESRHYERFPIRAEAVIPLQAWMQSLSGSGIAIRFESDAEQIYARWFDYNNEWATNQAGNCQLSLYVYDTGRWRYLGSGRQIESTPVLKLIFAPISKQTRSYMLYLPLSRNVRILELGVAEGTQIKAATPSTQKPVVFYSNSIIHGATASRPGNTMTSRLERHFNYPFINLGLSGSGLMEPAVVDLVAELDAAVFVIECVENMTPVSIRSDFRPGILKLHQRHPKTPILIVESIVYQSGYLIDERRKKYSQSNEALKEVYAQLMQQNVPYLTYVPGDRLIEDGDDTVDGDHPNDLGYYRMANYFIPLLAPFLANRSQSR